MRLCVSVCLSLASDFSQTIEVIIIKLGIFGLRHANTSHINYIDLDLHSGHTDLNYENKCSIISETFQAMPVKFAVKMVRLKVYNHVIFDSPMTLTVTHIFKW